MGQMGSLITRREMIECFITQGVNIPKFVIFCKGTCYEVCKSLNDDLVPTASVPEQTLKAKSLREHLEKAEREVQRLRKENEVLFFFKSHP